MIKSRNKSLKYEIGDGIIISLWNLAGSWTAVWINPSKFRINEKCISREFVKSWDLFILSLTSVSAPGDQTVRPGDNQYRLHQSISEDVSLHACYWIRNFEVSSTHGLDAASSSIDCLVCIDGFVCLSVRLPTWLAGCVCCPSVRPSVSPPVCLPATAFLSCSYDHGWPSTQPGSLHTALQRKYTQPCSLFSRGTAVWTMGARLCEQWGTAVCKCPAV